MAMEKIGGGDGKADMEQERRMARMMGSGHVDHQIRQAIQMLWMALPPEKKTVDEVEREFRRLSERALRDLREDSEALGFQR